MCRIVSYRDFRWQKYGKQNATGLQTQKFGHICNPVAEKYGEMAKKLFCAIQQTSEAQAYAKL